MLNSFTMAAIVLSAVSSGPVWAADAGEVAAEAYHRQHLLCNEVPRFGSGIAPMGDLAGDPEQDTYAYPVIGSDLICSDGSTAR